MAKKDADKKLPVLKKMKTGRAALDIYEEDEDEFVCVPAEMTMTSSSVTSRSSHVPPSTTKRASTVRDDSQSVVRGRGGSNYFAKQLPPSNVLNEQPPAITDIISQVGNLYKQITDRGGARAGAGVPTFLVCQHCGQTVNIDAERCWNCKLAPSR